MRASRQTETGAKRVISWAALAITLGLALSVNRAWALDLGEIRQKKILRVALPATDAPPYTLTQPDGTVGGLEGELMKDIARRMDVRIEFVRTARNGDELIAQVLDNRADVALGQLADSLERAKSVRFTTPYLTLYQVWLVDRLTSTRAGGITALLNRPDARLALYAESVALPLLREEMGAEHVAVFPTMEAALAAAKAGQAVAVAGDDVEIARWLSEHADTGIRWETHLRRDRPLTIAIAVAPSSENLHAWLNLYLDKSSRDEMLTKLWAKHLGEARMRPQK